MVTQNCLCASGSPKDRCAFCTRADMISGIVWAGGSDMRSTWLSWDLFSYCHVETAWWNVTSFHICPPTLFPSPKIRISLHCCDPDSSPFWDHRPASSVPPLQELRYKRVLVVLYPWKCLPWVTGDRGDFVSLLGCSNRIVILTAPRKDATCLYHCAALGEGVSCSCSVESNAATLTMNSPQTSCTTLHFLMKRN